MEPRHPKAVLSERGLTPKRSFGQNFLADARLASKLVELALSDGPSPAIEIGAGLGAMTVPLLARASKVVAIERDRDLAVALREIFAHELESEHLILHEADAKSFDYPGTLAGFETPGVIVGNLPYQITGPLLELLCGLASRMRRASVVVQLEVADRLCASPGSSAYGALSVFARAAFVPKRALVLRRGAFYPQPGVDSAAVLLEPRRDALARETPLFQGLVHAAFEQRRKQLRNAWSKLAFSSERLAAAAERAGIDLARRGETLSVEEFAEMERRLGE